MNTEQVFSSDYVQQRIASIENARLLLADYLVNRRQEAIQLLNINGIAISKDVSNKSLRIAFLKALKESDNFRTQVSQALTNYILSFNTDSQFAGSENARSNFNLFGAEELPAETTPTKATTTKTSFWNSLGSVFTPSVIQEGVKTGLTAISTSVQSKANQTSEQNAIAIEQLRLQQLQAQAEVNKTANTNTGMSTGWKIALGIIGGVMLIGIVVYVIRKPN